jgi:hypothetical protein
MRVIDGERAADANIDDVWISVGDADQTPKLIDQRADSHEPQQSFQATDGSLVNELTLNPTTLDQFGISFLGGDSASIVNFSNVSLTQQPTEVAAVPEPSTWAMLVLGFAVPSQRESSPLRLIQGTTQSRGRLGGPLIFKSSFTAWSRLSSQSTEGSSRSDAQG